MKIVHLKNGSVICDICKCVLFAKTWEKFIQITIYKFKINIVWFMSSNSKPYVKIDCQNVTFANRELKMCFIFEKIWEKFIRITIYKFKMNNHLWQIYGSCHPVRRNVKIVHLKTGSVKCRIWKQGVGCKYVCLNCKNIFFLTIVRFMSSSSTKHSNSYENRAPQNWLSQKWKYRISLNNVRGH